jgi:hypothetical protein
MGERARITNKTKTNYMTLIRSSTCRFPQNLLPLTPTLSPTEIPPIPLVVWHNSFTNWPTRAPTKHKKSDSNKVIHFSIFSISREFTQTLSGTPLKPRHFFPPILPANFFPRNWHSVRMRVLCNGTWQGYDASSPLLTWRAEKLLWRHMSIAAGMRLKGCNVMYN